MVYHGLDFARFPAPDAGADDNLERNGEDPDEPVVLLSVGRAVAKKGYGVLLDALARLPDELAWRLVHIGGGTDGDALKQRAADLGLGARIDWLGPQPQDVVLENYRAADLFVLASRIAADGDRDGLPNVLMEAQSQALACLSTDISAIPELIDDGETGVLVPPDDPAALAAALAALIRDPATRRRLGQAGMARVRRDFDLHAGIDDLAARFGLGRPAQAAQ